VQLFYCARTHSQLTQFVAELRRTEWARDVRLVPLAARTLLCVHKVCAIRVAYVCDDCRQGVRALRDANLIADKCDDLRKHTTANSGCPYYVSDKRSIEFILLTCMAEQR
jgi:chromosome transmission fidelity protein 1